MALLVRRDAHVLRRLAVPAIGGIVASLAVPGYLYLTIPLF
jgi:acetyl-CoA carboxylase beta subunit